MNDQPMTPDKLSCLGSVLVWFRDPCYDLFDLANTEEERNYLTAIQEVVTRTGAPNLALADYILRLEKRLLLIEQYVFCNP